MNPFRLLLLLLLLTLLLTTPSLPSFAGTTEAQLWEALRSPGHVALMRHALAPGTGDPANFTLNNPSTQRILSDQGRKQSRTIGDSFRRNGIASASVLTSQWNRCRETAELLGLGKPADLPILNSFFQSPSQRAPQTRALQEWLRKAELKQPTILVTHQVNITALTGVFPTSGEIVVVRVEPERDPVVLGTLKPW